MKSNTFELRISMLLLLTYKHIDVFEDSEQSGKVGEHENDMREYGFWSTILLSCVGFYYERIDKSDTIRKT